MIRAFNAARSALSLVAVLSWMLGIGAPLLYLAVLPVGVVLSGRPRRRLTSLYMKLVCEGILLGFRLGGARFTLRGRIPTGKPCVVLMNHQSLLDIVTTTLMGDPYVPAFVPRRRYARWYVPLVGACIGLLECPVVDPKRDPQGAIAAMRRAATLQHHGLLVFPEGHRSLDGEVRRFKVSGTVAVLSERRLPVYAVIGDGFWFGRRLVDFLLNVHRLRGETEVLGPFTAPAAAEEIPDFVQSVRAKIVERLQQIRAGRDAGL
jgi:1-acyl-sn-glycerol-3-phosphate acyltransferase